MLTRETVVVLRCDRRGCESALVPGLPWEPKEDLFSAGGLACFAVSLGWTKDRDDLDRARWLCVRCTLRKRPKEAGHERSPCV